MAQYVYTMNRVGKIVPPKRQILKDVSLSFFPGAKIGVLGLNGSGKSTLLKIMAGLDDEFSGEARLTPGFTVGLRRDAVAQVHHVPRRGPAPLDDVSRVRLEGGPPRGEQRGVDVALQGRAGQQGGGLVEGGAVVDADGVRPAAQLGEQVPGAGAEVEARHAHHRGERAPRVGGDVAGVVGARQGAAPAVEQLHRGRPRRHLGGHEVAGEAGAPGQQPIPRGRVGVHHRAGGEVVAAGPALHQVGRERERGPGEADERRPGRVAGRDAGEFGGHEGDGVRDGADVAEFVGDPVSYTHLTLPTNREV